MAAFIRAQIGNVVERTVGGLPTFRGETFDFSQQHAESMVGYKQNYFMGYRKCQNKPGGKHSSVKT